ncbi:integrase [Roseibium denhamense]|uniref:DUF6460 domain-containing protein n=1 Tax=Roseibium denhamense TaxID=76305 RepID=A0ABY1P4L2_9HYPH|nr:DUF6460 domain-containing protein [Roseibium denhamense]MTI07249.1 integrase [Roseibium denhamense]SMP26266.1 hypothetical protein SAMN06265374_2701 [Roseibium denhamense]
MSENSLNRFLGGTPAQVLLRLVFLSFVVGVILSALDIAPLDLIDMAVNFVVRLWNLGFDALGRIGSYFVIGAVVVIPIWLLTRLFSMGKSGS